MINLKKLLNETVGFGIETSVRDAKRAMAIFNDEFKQHTKSYAEYTNFFIFKDRNEATEFKKRLQSISSDYLQLIKTNFNEK